MKGKHRSLELSYVLRWESADGWKNQSEYEDLACISYVHVHI